MRSLLPMSDNTEATLVVDSRFTIAPLDPRLFGSFVEHMGRAVYTGLFEPDHPDADDNGFRTDVLALTRELGVTVLRYPGGNFVSGYRWEDGVGPVGGRPARLDLAWRQIESNRFGLDEFVRWARLAGVEPMMAVNLGTRGVQEACDLLEYANHPGGTRLSDQRIANGAADPHGIRLWCLGNEVDGDWQVGQKTAHEYGRLANETGKAMRLVDPDVELVLCGSSGSAMPTFGRWEAVALEAAYDVVDYISLHAYYEERDGDLASFLASPVDMDGFISSVVATADHVRAVLRKQKKIMLAFDEWNVWYMSRMSPAAEWRHAPPLAEDPYTAADAVVVGGCLITLLRHADRVRIACLAQLVNTIAPIRTETGGPAWRQSTFHPFALTALHARGAVLRVEITAPDVATEVYGSVPVVDAVATHDEESGRLAVFCVNRGTAASVPVRVHLSAFGPLQVAVATVLGGGDPRACNDSGATDRVQPQELRDVQVDGQELRFVLPPVCWAVVVLRPQAGPDQRGAEGRPLVR